MPSGTTLWALRSARAQAARMHQNAWQQIRRRPAGSKLRVAFVLIHVSVWKYDGLIRLLQQSDWAEPMLIIAPYLAQGADKMREDLEAARRYAEQSGVPCVFDSRLLEPNVDPHTLIPELPDMDVVFFSNPHPLTSRFYYADLYFNYPSCYVPYSYGMGYLNFNFDHYNQEFHNCMWRIFVPLNYHRQVFARSCTAGDEHVRVVGYPGVHDLLRGQAPGYSGWADDGRKKIIWAPHHTIAMKGLPLSNFLKVKDLMLQAKRERADAIEWAFRPHPLLKFNLIHTAGWTKEEVDSFWREWEVDAHLSDGDYLGLFASSDAIVHDSASFLVEYLYTRKPALYFDYAGEALGVMNEVGARALDAYAVARCDQDLHEFLDRVCSPEGAEPSVEVTRFIDEDVLSAAPVRPEQAMADALRQAALGFTAPDAEAVR